ncbi:MAG: NAD(P)H-hydrate dehydratase [Anaerolineae bacterium]|nr:NAD(P)H-hydrate dehydratase [Gloeobacterales cyanobacterium ES-bin-313]
MQRVESLLCASGMPVEALMEKVGLALSGTIDRLFSWESFRRVGVLVGPGHNGGDGLVVARELLLAGREVAVYTPATLSKPLTRSHCQYFVSLGGQVFSDFSKLPNVDLWIDGLFGFGLTRPVTGVYADAIQAVNGSGIPIVALDVPSGMDTDTGSILGTAIRATHTFCLGLWKRGLWQDCALEYLGEVERIDFGLQDQQIQTALRVSAQETSATAPEKTDDPTTTSVEKTGTISVDHSEITLLLDDEARAGLPLQRSLLAHKYTVGSTLVIAGSLQYSGAVHLAALGARASGTGMLTLAVPGSLRASLVPDFPEALIVGCPEDSKGCLSALNLDLARYQSVVFGPGLGQFNPQILRQVIVNASGILVLDADGLNQLAGNLDWLSERPGSTILTPHPGEFCRLFPDIDLRDRFDAARHAAQRTGTWILLKGARTVISSPSERLWVNPVGSSALARGGSGDVLAGLIGGLAAQTREVQAAILSGVWWHAQTGAYLAKKRTVLGVPPQVLADGLLDWLE